MGAPVRNLHMGRKRSEMKRRARAVEDLLMHGLCGRCGHWRNAHRAFQGSTNAWKPCRVSGCACLRFHAED